MYDISTKNVSFIKMFKLLKDLGIKNNKFFLWLNDEKLVGVDPYDPNLSGEKKLRIQTEVMTNFWYYLREIVRIPESGGHVHFQLHRANLGQMFLMENNVDIIEILPRQHGKTIGAVCRYTWVYHFGTINTHMIFSNKQYGDSQLNIKRFNDITELLPDYLKTHLNERNDTNNLAQIACAKNNNKIDAMSTARTISDADKLGRGCTVPLVWYDEFAFLKYNDTVYASAAPALSKASQSAEKNGTPYGKLITTTPNDLDTDNGSFCHGMIQLACPFDEIWYDWDIKDVKRFIEENSENDFVHLQFTYEELGNDEEWFKKQCRNLNHDLLKIKRELLLEWTIASDTSPFNEEQLAEIEKYAKSPIGKFYVMGKYKFEIFGDMRNMLQKSWLVGIDVGGGLKRDFTAITIIEPTTREIKAVFKSNGIGVTDLKEVIVELILTYIPNAVIIPERNSLGIALIDHLLKSEVADNLYYEVRERKGEKVVDDPKRASKRMAKSKVRVYGVSTDKNTRPIMIEEILFNAVNEEPHVFTSKHIFDEIKKLERTNKGKIEHREGCHDDVLFSWLVANYALLYGSNINKFVKYVSNNAPHQSEDDDPFKISKTALNMKELYRNSDEFVLASMMIEKAKSEEQFQEHKEMDMRKKRRMKSLGFLSGLNK